MNPEIEIDSFETESEVMREPEPSSEVCVTLPPYKDCLPPEPPSVPQILEDMRETFEERAKVYGNSYRHAGAVLKSWFPKGLILETEHDFAELAVWAIMAHKLCRNFNDRNPEGRGPVRMSQLGHRDSIHDNAVYMAILEELFANRPE